jgi:hypothetical protein
MKKVKTISSHVGVFRYLRECYSRHVGYIPRQREIRSPYAWGPTHIIWKHKTTGRYVFIVETSHKRYEVYETPRDLIKVRESQIIG